MKLIAAIVALLAATSIGMALDAIPPGMAWGNGTRSRFNTWRVCYLKGCSRGWWIYSTDTEFKALLKVWWCRGWYRSNCSDLYSWFSRRALPDSFWSRAHLLLFSRCPALQSTLRSLQKRLHWSWVWRRISPQCSAAWSSPCLRNQYWGRQQILRLMA